MVAGDRKCAVRMYEVTPAPWHSVLALPAGPGPGASALYVTDRVRRHFRPIRITIRETVLKY
eukprot:7323439-Prymnesium_polylepis.2